MSWLSRPSAASTSTPLVTPPSGSRGEARSASTGARWPPLNSARVATRVDRPCPRAEAKSPHDRDRLLRSHDTTGRTVRCSPRSSPSALTARWRSTAALKDAGSISDERAADILTQLRGVRPFVETDFAPDVIAEDRLGSTSKRLLEGDHRRAARRWVQRLQRRRRGLDATTRSLPRPPTPLLPRGAADGACRA